MSEPDKSRIEIHKVKVEVLPPLQEERASGRVFYSSGGGIKIVRLGPLGALGVFLLVGLFLAAGFFFLGGLLLLLAPLFVLGGVGAYLLNRFGGGRLLR